MWSGYGKSIKNLSSTAVKSGEYKDKIVTDKETGAKKIESSFTAYGVEVTNEKP